MNEEDYIESAKAKNAHLFAAEKVKITPAAIEAMLRHAFRAGQERGEQIGETRGRLFGGGFPKNPFA